MAESFELEIIHPTKSERYTVLWVAVESERGNFIIGPGHAPLLALLKKKGDLKFETTDKKKLSEPIFGGIVTVDLQKMVIIIDS